MDSPKISTEHRSSKAVTNGLIWSRKYSKCIQCGTTKRKHIAKGLCSKCYQIANAKKHSRHYRERGVARKKLTEEFLIQSYVDNQLSLEDITKTCCCTRQYVYRKMKEYAIGEEVTTN